MEKKCLNCGKIFTTMRVNKYCSDECKKIYLATATTISICQICGMSFERRVSKPYICPECRREMYNKNSEIENYKKADFSEYEKWHKETKGSYGEWQTMKRKEKGEVW